MDWLPGRRLVFHNCFLMLRSAHLVTFLWMYFLYIIRSYDAITAWHTDTLSHTLMSHIAKVLLMSLYDKFLWSILIRVFRWRQRFLSMWFSSECHLTFYMKDNHIMTNITIVQNWKEFNAYKVIKIIMSWLSNTRNNVAWVAWSRAVTRRYPLITWHHVVCLKMKSHWKIIWIYRPDSCPFIWNI